MAALTMKYEVKFLNPAFLGNAEQEGQWRTPPFKALLRQWWRVAVAKEVNYDYPKLRAREARLFGHAWLENDTDKKGNKVAARVSKVRMRLYPWSPGGLTGDEWPKQFANVTTTRDCKGKVSSDLYLGFGPILAPSRKKSRKSVALAHKAIQPSQKATLSIRARGCGDEEQCLVDAMRLAHLFGTLGSRSRNGWGSLHARPIEEADRRPLCQLLAAVTRPLDGCLSSDWASALGADERGRLLVWVTKEPMTDWEAAVDQFARILVAVRRVAKDYHPSRPANGLNGIHLLGYPAGNKWKLTAWGDDRRLASQLKFKLVCLEGHLKGIVFHTPCDIPKPLKDKLKDPNDIDWLRNNQVSVWQAVHKWLDDDSGLDRLDEPTLDRLEG